MASKESKLKNVVNSDHDSSSEAEEDDLGFSLDKLSLGPQKKLLVLSLGGLTVRRVHRRNDPIPSNRRADFSYGNFLIYKRPFCDGFLRFCFERFEVGLWSSALEFAKHRWRFEQGLGSELKSKLLFTWDQEECTDTGFKCLENKRKPLFCKELKHIWQKKYSSLPWRDGEYSSSNTLLIGTDPHKALLNPPNTAIFPKEYDPEDEEDELLGLKGELRAFLDGAAEANDMQTYVKDHPFGEPAITSTHSDWNYYSKIIRRFE